LQHSVVKTLVDTRHEFTEKRRAHWNRLAGEDRRRGVCGRAYHARLAEVYKTHIAPGQRVLEVGCAQGELLASVDSSRAVGVDLADRMIARASERHPAICFQRADAHDLGILDERFDVVILSDLLNDVWDVQAVLEQVATVCHSRTRIILNVYSRLWEVPLGVAARLGLSRPRLPQNWLTVEDLSNLLNLAGFELIKHWEEFLWPFRTPVVSAFANRGLVKVWPFRAFALSNFLMARPRPSRTSAPALGVSIVVPARNEAGNINSIFERTKYLTNAELVFVEGHSTDGTYEAVQEAIEKHPEVPARVYRQTGAGKGDAVRLGFSNAKGDLLIILDADMTVAPEDIPRFIEAVQSGVGELVNGVRLVYPMEHGAMRFWNLIGNKFFSLSFSWVLGQPLKDTLCGTKALRAADYNLIAANRAYFGELDPFGDFDLLFGAAKLGLRIVDLPIRYRERTYGTTNIQRWRHGWLLLRMLVLGARRLKFV
jgi:SAM-dependent methyltransferase